MIVSNVILNTTKKSASCLLIKSQSGPPIARLISLYSIRKYSGKFKCSIQSTASLNKALPEKRLSTNQKQRTNDRPPTSATNKHLIVKITNGSLITLPNKNCGIDKSVEDKVISLRQHGVRDCDFDTERV